MYLSLSMLLIMALLGTMLEVSRGKICHVHSRRTLHVAAERLMTEYNRPLYDRYGLFFLEDSGESFQQCVARYAGEILDGKNLYDGALQDVKVSEKRYVGDYGGAALLQQVEEKMKRQLAENFIRNGVSEQHDLSSVEEAATEIDNEVQRQREDAEAGIQLLELMELVDGVSCESGRVRGKTYFTKMFCYGEKRGEAFGITEKAVWNAIKGNVISLEEIFPKLTDGETKTQFINQVKKARRRTEKAIDIMKQLGSRLDGLKLGKDPIAALESNRSILERTEQQLAMEVTTEIVEELQELWKGYNTKGIVFRYTGVAEEGGGENPLDCFTDTLAGGVLKLVLDDASVSQKAFDKADGYREWYEASENDVEYKGTVENFAKNQDVQLQGAVENLGEISMSDFLLCEYGKAFFLSWKEFSSSDEHVLDYELEYLVSGKRTDKKNLEQVVNRLFLLRTVINTTAVMGSTEHRETAYTAALSVVGFTGMEPLIRFTQTLFLVMWGMAEALIDVAGILQGKQVKLMKTKADLKVAFSEMFQFGREYVLVEAGKLPKAGSNSFGYEDYIALFLLGNKRATTCYRMMDLMQENVRQGGVEQFNLGMCVDSFQLQGVFSYETKFFRVPHIQQIVERELYQFHVDTDIRMTYVTN